MMQHASEISAEERGRVVEGILLCGQLFKMLDRIEKEGDRDTLTLAIRHISIHISNTLTSYGLGPEVGAQWFNEAMALTPNLNVYTEMTMTQQNQIMLINDMKDI